MTSPTTSPMTKWINYHHLYYFKTIAEEESVSKAAAKLSLGQPTLSAQLKQFEEQLGVQLFERKHKKLTLTEQGRIALDYAQNIFRLGGEMFEVLNDHITPTRVHLKIGALDSIPKELILQLSKSAYDISQCNISLVEGRIEDMLQDLSTHRLDLLVTNYLPVSSESKNLVHRSVVKKPVSIFGSSRFKNLRKDFPDSVSGQKFVVPTFDSKLRHDIEHWAKQNQIKMDIIAETQDISLKKMLAGEGIGLIPAAPHNVAQQVESGELIEVGPLKGVFEELFLIAAERKIANPIAAKLFKTFSV